MGEDHPVIVALEARYQQAKADYPPQTIPKASPSRAHYNERHQGFLSGLLVAIDVAREALKKAGAP